MRHLFQVRRHFFCLSVCLILGADLPTSAADDGPTESVTHLTGRRLDQELARTVNIVLNRTTPRAAVQRLQELHHIAVLLDRRIDPDRMIDVQLVQVTLEEGLHLLAAQCGAEYARIGGTLYLGPAGSVDRLRTLIALRTAELRERTGEERIRRQAELLRGQPFSWSDLTRPDDLLAEVAQSFHLQRPTERLAHDLWAGGAMADVNAAEALSLLLGQFDLTISWQGDNSLRIVPVPEHATIERTHTPRRMTAAEAIEQIQQAWPHLDPIEVGRAIKVQATVGEHEDIAALLDGRPAMEQDTDPAPLSARRFTLKAQRAKVIAILRTLETQGISIQYDRGELRAAGIDLSASVSLELDMASADELFTALCDPLGLAYTITSDDMRIVRLTPKE